MNTQEIPTDRDSSLNPTKDISQMTTIDLCSNSALNRSSFEEQLEINLLTYVPNPLNNATIYLSTREIQGTSLLHFYSHNQCKVGITKSSEYSHDNLCFPKWWRSLGK
jgi:hypothetical protein